MGHRAAQILYRLSRLIMFIARGGIIPRGLGYAGAYGNGMCRVGAVMFWKGFQGTFYCFFFSTVLCCDKV